jgi:hypothetical protein
VVSAIQYLCDRFRSDADALRQRAATLRATPPQPGPDGATSLRMADACDDVVDMVGAIPDDDDAGTMIASLTALIPLLERRAAAVASVPPVRAVFAGAATRIREIADAEARNQDTDADPDAVDSADEEEE